MKIKLTETQYEFLSGYLNEDRKAVIPTSLKALFNDNPNAKFFSVIKKIKGGNTDEYDFKIETEGGFKQITDINKGTNTKGCSIEANLDTIIYGTQFKLNFGSCGVLTLNNIIGIKLFLSEDDLRNNKPMDTMELEHDLDKTISELADKYYTMLKSIEVGEEIYIDSKFKYDGEVTIKDVNRVQIDLQKHGIEGPPLTTVIDLNDNPFKEIDGELILKTMVTKRGSDSPQKEFNLIIKNFSVTEKPIKKAPVNKKSEEKSSEQLKADGKKALELILNDPELKNAFYKQPSLWNLFLAELKGKKAIGSGIIPTLDLVGKYENKKLSEILEADFIEGLEVQYRLSSKVKIYYTNYDGREDIFELKPDTPYVIDVAHRDLGENGYVLEDMKLKYRIIIRKKTNIVNVYNCDVIKYDDNTEGLGHEAHNINVKFYISDFYPGYKPKPKETNKLFQSKTQVKK